MEEDDTLKNQTLCKGRAGCASRVCANFFKTAVCQIWRLHAHFPPTNFAQSWFQSIARCVCIFAFSYFCASSSLGLSTAGRQTKCGRGAAPPPIPLASVQPTGPTMPVYLFLPLPDVIAQILKTLQILVLRQRPKYNRDQTFHFKSRAHSYNSQQNVSFHKSTD